MILLNYLLISNYSIQANLANEISTLEYKIIWELETWKKAEV